MSMDLSQMFLIRGNIRQQYLPFVLKPGSNINANVTDDHEITDGPQFFSFRNKKADDYNAGFGRLNICPSVFSSPEFGLYFNKDMSNKLLFDFESDKKITIDSFFNHLPSVQIREFQVDAKLDNFINMFFELFQSGKGLFKEFKLSDMVGMGDSAARDRWMDMFKDVMTTVWDFALGQRRYTAGPSFMQGSDGSSRWVDKALKADFIVSSSALKGVLAGAVAGGPAGLAVAGASLVANCIDLDTYIKDFPYMMYYRLLSCTSLNVYEIPCVSEQLWQTDGSTGWDIEAFRLTDMISGGGGKNGGSMVNKVLDMVTGGLQDVIKRAQVNYMPKWDPSGNGMQDGLTVTFDLFNDTAEAAMKNFIFVNTIIPNNMWMQYGMLKHSPCVYDVKIEGVKRLFMCAADFKVKAGGLMRTPPSDWIQELCYKHANNGGDDGKSAGNWSPDTLIESIHAGNLIKLPDVYTVEMTFKSLLPVNFNNFLYDFSRNGSMQTYANKDAHIPNAVGDILRGIQTDLGKEIQSVVEKGNKDIKAIRAESNREKNRAAVQKNEG